MKPRSLRISIKNPALAVVVVLVSEYVFLFGSCVPQGRYKASIIKEKSTRSVQIFKTTYSLRVPFWKETACASIHKAHIFSALL